VRYIYILITTLFFSLSQPVQSAPRETDLPENCPLVPCSPFVENFDEIDLSGFIFGPPVATVDAVPRFADTNCRTIQKNLGPVTSTPGNRLKNSVVRIDDEGNIEINGIIKNGIQINWPSTIGAAGTFLESDGTGNLIYAFPPGGGGGNVSTALAFTAENLLVRTDTNSGAMYVQESGVTLDNSNNISNVDTLTANTIVATNIIGSVTDFTGSLAGDVTGPQNATVVAFVDGVTAANVAAGANAANAATSANIFGTIVKRDAAGNFSATDITATLLGNATTATSAITSISTLSAIDFTGPLAGDVTGTQSATVVSLVDGVTAANIAAGATAANNATSANIFGTIVKRDAAGNFSATDITASLTGAASLNVLKAGDSMTGDLTMLDQTAVIFQDSMADHNFVGVQAPATVTASYTLALPTTTPTVNQVLTAGPTTPTNLVWITNGGSILPAVSNTIYVTTYGNDVTGNGSFTSPYLTLAKAISTANGISSPSTILVGTGTFTENNPLVVTASNLSIIGESPIATIIMPNTAGQPLLSTSQTILINRIAFSSPFVTQAATGILLTGGNLSNFNAVRITNFLTGISCAGSTSSYSFISSLFIANGTGLSLSSTSAECDDCTFTGAASLAGPAANTGISITGSSTNLVVNGGAVGLCNTGINVTGSASLTANAVVFKRNTFPIVETNLAQMTLTGCTFAIPTGTLPIDIQASGIGTAAEIIGCEFNGTNAMGNPLGSGIVVTSNATVDISGGGMQDFVTGLQIGGPTDTSTTILTLSSFVIRGCTQDIVQQGTATLNVNASTLSSTNISISNPLNVSMAFFDLDNNSALTIGSSSNVDTPLLFADIATTNTPSLDYLPSLYSSQAIGLINPAANPTSLFVLSTQAADLTAITTNRADIAGVRLVSDTGTPVGGTSALRGWDINKNGSSAELSFNYQNTDTNGQAAFLEYNVMQISGVANQLQFPNANTQIVFSGDTNLFRSSADVLATTSNFIVAPLTPGRVVITDPTTNELSSSVTTSTELSYLSGVTSPIQTQLNNKLSLTGGTLTGTLTLPAGNASSPSLTFTGGPGVGLSSNSGNLSFSTDGSEQMQISSSGAISIDSFTTAGVVHNNGNPTNTLFSALIINGDIAANAGIVDTKLAIISTPGQVANSATTATSANVVNTIVQRDSSGNFAANSITAIDGFVGNITGSASLDLPLTGGTLTGDLEIPGGSIGSPSLTFSNSSSGTGISAPVANTLSFDIIGTEVINISGASGGTVTVDNFTTSGVVHNTSGGVLFTQLVEDPDIAAATITNDKLANISSSNIPGDIVVRDSVGDFITDMITITGTPTNPTDVATVSYVNTAVSTGLVAKSPAVVVATSNVTIAGAQTIDSVFVSTNDRVLTVAQTSAVDNGIWLVQDPGAWTYPTDWVPGNIAGEAYVLILEGLVYGGSSWLCSTPEAIIGFSDVDFVEFSLPNQTTAANQGSGAGTLFIDKTGNVLNFKTIAAGTHIDIINDPTDVTIATDATSANTFGTIVSRDSLGDFSATNITANLTGNASGNVLLTGDSMTGNLTMLDQTAVVFQDTDTNYVGIQAPITLAGSYTVELPTTVPTANQSLRAGPTTPTDLVWVTDGGSVPATESYTFYVTKYGNDSTGNGSFDAPYLTLAKALGVAGGMASNTTPVAIIVGTGTFQENNSSGALSITASGISIIGESPIATIIEPSSSAFSLLSISGTVLIKNIAFTSTFPTQAATGIALTAGNASNFNAVRITNFLTGITCTGGTSSYSFINCLLIANGTGLSLSSTTAECDGCIITGAASLAGPPANTGISLTGAGTNLVLTGGACGLCSIGISLSNNAALTASSVVFNRNSFAIEETGPAQMTLTGCSFAISTNSSNINIQASGSGAMANIIGCEFNGNNASNVAEGMGLMVSSDAVVTISGGNMQDFGTAIQVGIGGDTASTVLTAEGLVISGSATADIVQEGSATLYFNAGTTTTSKITLSNPATASLTYFDTGNSNYLTIGSLANVNTPLLFAAISAIDTPSLDYQSSLYSTQAIGLINPAANPTSLFVLSTEAADLTAITTNRADIAGVRLVSDTGTPVGGTSALRGWDINKNASSAELSFNYQNTDTTGQVAIAEYNVMQISGVANQLQFPNANTQIVFSGDTNLFRTAADVLATTSNFIVGPLTPGRVVITDPTTNELSSSVTTSTEESYVSGVTSSIQTQLNSKLPLSGGTLTGTLTLPAGSIANPSLQFTGNGTTNTGLSSPAQNTISFDINGSEAMNINSAGNVTVDHSLTIDGSLILTSPLTVANGGTGETSFTAYAPITGGTSTTGMLQSASAGMATSGFILTSTGSSSLPTWQAPAASNISITGDTGGALTGDAFTFTGGTTGLTFAGATTTETLGGTLVVAHGGTGATTLTAHGVLLGEGTGAISFTPVGTAGQVLLGTGADPNWVTPSAGPGLTIVDTSSVLSYALSTPVTVANGGTGATTLTAHGVLLGEGTGAVSSTVAGTAGQLLLGTGTSTDPIWVTPTAGTGLTIVDSSSALSYALSTPVTVANGGTGATTLLAHGVLLGEGTAAVSSTLVGTAGQVLVGTGADPNWVTPMAGTGLTINDTSSVLSYALSTPVTVANGGTGDTTLTAHGVLLGEGTSPINQTAAGTNGQVLIGANSADPAFATLTSTGGTITFSPGANSLNLEVTGGSAIDTIAGNSGSATGTTVTITTGASKAQGTALFTGSGSTLTETFTTATGNNTGIGLSALDSLTAGTGNTAFGSGALNLLTVAVDNTAVGYQALQANVSAANNTAVGYQALTALVGSGGNGANTAVGMNSMKAMTSGVNNTAIGYGSLTGATTAGENAAFGFNVFPSLLSGTYNMGMGINSGTGYTGAESSNIIINAPGNLGESNVLRIGTATGTGVQDLAAAYICGIQGVSIGSVASVVTIGGTNANQLGSATIAGSTGITVAPGAGTITISSTNGLPITTIDGNTGTATGATVTITTGASKAQGTALFTGAGSTLTQTFTTATGNNTGLGLSALDSLSTGTANTAFGSAALNLTTTGMENTAVGTQALQNNVSAIANTAVGYQALAAAIGNSGLGSNTAVGSLALSGLTTGTSNTALGDAAGFSITTGNNNIAIGNPGVAATSNTIYLGQSSHVNTFLQGNINIPASSTTVGNIVQSGTVILTTAGTNNAFFGANAGNLTSTGSGQNVGIGVNALKVLSSGSSNAVLGFDAAAALTSGTLNVAVGAGSLQINTSGSANTAVGYQSLNQTTAGSNVTAVGYQALLNATGTGNTALGFQAGSELANGINNIFIGPNTGSAQIGSENSNILIGSTGISGTSNSIQIGIPIAGGATAPTTTYIGGIANSTVTGSAVFINTSTGQLGLATSARRFKENIKPISDETAYAFMKLNPVSFWYKTDDTHATQYGLIAEEVEEHMPELVVYDADGNVYTVASHLLYALLLDRIKRDHAQLQELKAGMAELRAIIDANGLKLQPAAVH
jgi:trimeric autotransporter adhesin